MFDPKKLLAAAGATLLLSAVGSTPAAAAPKNFYGVVPIQHPTVSEVNALGRARVGTLRIVLSWPTVEPIRGQRRWAPYDRLIEAAALNGIRVLPTIYGSPPFAAKRTEAPPGRKSRRAFARFVRDAAARYGRGGHFWRAFALEHPGVQPLAISWWQLWNEVNSPSFWSKKPSAKQYAKLLKLTSRKIRKQDRRARILLAGLFTKPNRKRAIRIDRYLNALYKVKKIKKFFHGAAIHPYARGPKHSFKAVRRLRQLLNRNGDRKAKIWVTEIGWASSGRKTRFTAGPAGQAKKLRKLFRKLTKTRRKLKVKGVIWYSLRDAAFGDDWLHRSGLFTAGGAPKPAWYSFVGFTGGSP